jgi:DNA-binding transcriptional MerR regulator/DNA gyrase inhibitor GyrI
MYKIGEFSKIVSLTVKALRYYDEINLLKPSHINDENGYRYYDEASYYTAIRIRTLKKYGFSIKEIQEVLPRIQSNSDMSDFLMEKSTQLENQVKSIRKVQQQINNEIVHLQEVTTMTNQMKPEIRTIESMKVASVRYKGRYDEVGIYLGKIFKVIGMKGKSAPFSMYHDSEFTEENADIEVCVEVSGDINKGEVSTKTLPTVKCVCMTHMGPYDTLSSTYKAMADFMNEQGLEGEIPSREQYVKGPGMLFKGNPEKYETLIMIPIKT